MNTSATTDITFESGYGRLQAIATRLGVTEVPVSEMVDLYDEGKGLETSLLSHLDEAKARVEQIERGEHVQQFRIVATADTCDGQTPADTARQTPPFTADFTPKTPTTTTDDDIPF
jgi:exodeoxyribonuclease VII small subunit